MLIPPWLFWCPESFWSMDFTHEKQCSPSCCFQFSWTAVDKIARQDGTLSFLFHHKFSIRLRSRQFAGRIIEFICLFWRKASTHFALWLRCIYHHKEWEKCPEFWCTPVHLYLRLWCLIFSLLEPCFLLFSYYCWFSFGFSVFKPHFIQKISYHFETNIDFCFYSFVFYLFCPTAC